MEMKNSIEKVVKVLWLLVSCLEQIPIMMVILSIQKILKFKPLDSLFWGEGIPGIFSGEHRFILEELDHKRTLLRHDEDFWGLALPFIPLGPEYIEEGYNLMNKAAKDRAEQLFNKRGSQAAKQVTISIQNQMKKNTISINSPLKS